jgi:hypothetical protein
MDLRCAIPRFKDRPEADRHRPANALNLRCMIYTNSPAVHKAARDCGRANGRWVPFRFRRIISNKDAEMRGGVHRLVTENDRVADPNTELLEEIATSRFQVKYIRTNVTYHSDSGEKPSRAWVSSMGDRNTEFFGVFFLAEKRWLYLLSSGEMVGWGQLPEHFDGTGNIYTDPHGGMLELSLDGDQDGIHHYLVPLAPGTRPPGSKFPTHLKGQLPQEGDSVQTCLGVIQARVGLWGLYGEQGGNVAQGVYPLSNMTEACKPRGLAELWDIKNTELAQLWPEMLTWLRPYLAKGLTL